MTAELIVLAKAPVPGRVKTRLCPPCTPEQAALIAAAALADTIGTVSAAPARSRVLALAGSYPLPAGWFPRPQHGDDLGERIANAFTGPSSLLIGMDTPQVTTAGLTGATAALADADAVLGPSADGGWWALGLRDPAHARAIRRVPTSRADTGARTLAVLRGLGLRVAILPVLRDVDTAADAAEVAALCPPGSRFATAVMTTLATPAARAGREPAAVQA